MKKIIKTLTVITLALSSLIINPMVPKVIIQAETDSSNEIYYNSFEDRSGEWLTLQNSIVGTLNAGSIKLENKGDSMILNEDDQVRNNGDVAVNFEYNTQINCFGFIIRGSTSPNTRYQNVVYNFKNKSWLLGQSGNWVTLKGVDFEINEGQDVSMVARYEGSNLTIYVDGAKVFDKVVDAGTGKGPVSSTLEGKTGIRMYCGEQTVVVNSFVSGPLNSIPNEGFPEIGKDLSYYDFEESVDTLTDIVGSFDKKVADGKLVLTNKVQESILYDAGDKVRSSGDIEMDFNYKAGGRCFGPTFRSGSGSGQWQTVAYQIAGNGDTSWVIGHPSGYWSKAYPADKLVPGKDYKLVVRYKDASIQLYLNGELVLDEAVVDTPKGSINPNDSSGTVGFRKYCETGDIEIDRLISADYNVIPNEGMHTIKQIKAEKEVPVDPGEPEENEAYYALIRKTRKDQKVGDFSEKELKDPQIGQYVSNLVDDTTNLVNLANPASEWTSKGIWTKKPTDTVSANITTQFKNLNKLSQAYALRASADLNPYYQNAQHLAFIEEALAFLTGDTWFDGVKLSGNWWDWQVGIPQELIDILIILYEDLPKEDVKKYATIITKYVPDPTRQAVSSTQGVYVDIKLSSMTAGANRTDLALTYLATGILLEKKAILNGVIPSIDGVINTVSKGDGFYDDGSFIQHGDIPYTGSYGNITIKGVGKILSLLEGTPWQMSEERIQIFSELVYEAFVPGIYKGETMPMVGGRSISRAPGARKKGFGSATIFNLLITSNFASEPYKSKLKEAAKYWILEDETEYYFNNNRDLRDLLEVKSVLNDAQIDGTKVPYLGSKMFAAMDRFVHTSETYSAGISMYSSRISAFESGNKENQKGWHTSDGMVYIQNQDSMYGESYWPTVDSLRLPGTTVATRYLAPELGSFARQRSPQSYVGGASDGNNSAIGMVLNKNGFKNNGTEIGYNLKAFKSWFVSNDVIYALGAGINGSSNSTGSIETIVENRLMDPKMAYELISNLNFTNNSTMNVKKGDWFTLKAKDQRNNLTYVFLEDQTIQLVKETNTGKYIDINGAFVNDKTYTETYQKIIIKHGDQAVNESYAYATLVGKSESEVLAFLQSDVELVENTVDKQYIRVGNVRLANIFPDAGGEIGDVKVKGAASLVIVEDDKSITVNSADSKQTSSVFEFEVNRGRLYLEGETPSDDESVTFSVNNAGKAGKTSTVRLLKFANLEDLQQSIDVFELIDTDLLTEYSLNQYQDLQERIESIKNDINATQGEVDQLNSEIQIFNKDHDLIIDFDFVDITIAYFNNLDKNVYTEKSWDEAELLVDTLTDMKSQYDPSLKLVVRADEVKQKLDLLQESIRNLEIKDTTDLGSVDKSILIELIDLYDSLIGTEGFAPTAKLKTLIDLARVYQTSDEVSQDDVDALVGSLIIEFEKSSSEEGGSSEDKVDISILQGLINQFDSLKKDDYTTASYDSLRIEIRKARVLVADKNLTQKQVDDAVQKIRALFDALVKVDANKDDTDSDKGNKPKDEMPDVGLGIGENYVVYIVGATLLVIGLGLLLKKRGEIETI